MNRAFGRDHLTVSAVSSATDEYPPFEDIRIHDPMYLENAAYKDWYAKYQREHGRCPTDVECDEW